jgi:type IV pilus assembly protein PilW
MRRRSGRGFTLVEIMVAMLIGLIGSIVIFQVLAVSERQKRTTTGAGDAQQNGLLGLFAIERDARMAGYGFNYVPVLGCNVLGHDGDGPRDFSFPLVPVRITDGAAGAADSISFVYGSSALLVVPAKLTQTSPVDGTENKVANRFGFQVNELVLLGEAGKDCTLRQVTSLPPAIGATDQVHHTTGRYNKPNPGGTTVSYSAWDNTLQTGGRLFGLGLAPVAGTYSVQNDELMFQNLITDTAAVSVTDSIVQLQAEYGRDMNGDGKIDPDPLGPDRWEATMPVGATPVDWSRVLAVRVAVVARSAQPEPREPGASACTTTTQLPKWKDDGMGGGTPIAVDADPNWQCYRYRVFETTVPLRNMIWVAL